MQVSIIITVKNEGEGLRPLLDSLLQQTRLPDEVVFTDAGSTDNTLAVLEEYQTYLPLRIILAPGSNISQGRNRAIEAAGGEIIACTDAGVMLSPGWVEELIRPILEDHAVVVSGWFEPDPYTNFEVVLGATVLPDRTDVRPETFLPSSRSVAYLKSAWQAVGGYPEWLDYSEDLIFDLALRRHYGTFAFAPGAIAYFRPRGSLNAFARQYYRYAHGDGKANLWPRRHLARYLAYLLVLPLLLRSVARGKWAGAVVLAAGVAAYCLRPAQRLWQWTFGWRPLTRLRAFALIPVIRLVGDLAKMLGYPAGAIWRWRRRERS